jgi:NADH-quinone oxidoreductase subunit F
MTAEKTINLEEYKDQFYDNFKKVTKRIIICAGTACVANGALNLSKKFQDLLKEKNINAFVELDNHDDNKGIYVSKSGCQGFCQMGPLVTILPEGIFYTKVKVDDVEEIIDSTLVNNNLIERLLYSDHETKKRCKTTDEITFYRKQHRYVLKNCGKIDPEDINEYIAADGYKALKKVCLEMTSEEVCQDILASGLRGRGGGGFPTGRKWELTRKENSVKKYVICNGDEGDPGAFMDRSVMEGNPHSVIEGMVIAARAIGADEGYIYVRAEYPLAVKRMRKAVLDAEKAGILGNNIFGSDHSFKLHVMEGAGAFVCGEETALMASIQGERGMPLPKPPFPAQSGLWGKPTVINNVETLATIALIINDGANEFRKIGTPNSPGTKTFAVTGHVANTGLIEVPFGTTLREVIFEIAGGVTDKKGKIHPDNFKAVQIGGPSGGCLTGKNLDLPLDFDSLKGAGAMVGSGGLVVMNNDTCMVNIASFFMQFTQNESCGKCILCREGTKQMLTLLEDIKKGNGTEKTIGLLQELATSVQKGSLCALGKTAPSPVLSTIAQFKDEYIEHIVDKKCKTGSCKNLIEIKIVPDLCKGCTLCARKCPSNAIQGEKGKPHVINKAVCTKCGICVAACKFNAITN